MHERNVGIVAIGASAGGVMAIRHILNAIDPEFVVPVVVVQHLLPTARPNVELIYGMGKGLRVLEAEDKMKIEPGTVYMAAPGYHLLMEKDSSLSVSLDEPVNFSRPSIDVFFESVARVMGPRTIGVLLTGANSDGAQGLSEIGESGGVTIIQDPEEAEVDIMPKSALKLRQPDFVLSLDGIAGYMNALTAKNTELFV